MRVLGITKETIDMLEDIRFKIKFIKKYACRYVWQNKRVFFVSSRRIYHVFISLNNSFMESCTGALIVLNTFGYTTTQPVVIPYLIQKKL